MKKLVLLFSAVLITSVFSYAQTNNNCTLKIDSVYISGLDPGETVNIPVRMVSADKSIMGWEFYIKFDGSYFSWAPGFLQNKTTLFPGNWFEGINDAGDGNLVFAANWLDPNFAGIAIPAETLLFELELTYIGGLVHGESTYFKWTFNRKKDTRLEGIGVTAVVNSDSEFFELITLDGCLSP